MDYQLERLERIKNITAGHSKIDVNWLIDEVERMRAALLRIEAWDFDITGDCVADAQKLANDTIFGFYEDCV